MRLVSKLVLIILFLSFVIPVNVYASDFGTVDHGSGDDQSLADLFRTQQQEQMDNINTEQFNTSSNKIRDFAGYVISALTYIFFAMLFFTTACDLLYISVPFSRKYLYPAGATGGSNWNSAMHNVAASWVDSANRATNEASYIRRMNYARRNEAIAQYRDANWGTQGKNNDGYCLLSDTMKSLAPELAHINNAKKYGYGKAENIEAMRDIFGDMGYGNTSNSLVPNITKTVLEKYLKKRVVAIIAIIVIFLILTTNIIFIQGGLNIGKFILDLILGAPEALS